MRVTADAGALAFIREHGGMVFIRPYRMTFCSPVVDIEATTEPPRGALDYQREVVSEDFLLFFHPAIRRRPEELVVAVRGRRRQRVRVYWDGCTVGY